MKNRITAILLLGAMLFTLAACSENNANPDESTQDTDAVSPAEESDTESAESEDDYSEYYPTNTYNGASFCMLNQNEEDWCINTVDAEEITGDALNDAIFDRNSRIEEMLGVEITQLLTGSVSGDIKVAINAGDSSYSIAYPDLSDCASLSQQKNLYNLSEVEGLNLDMPWWDQYANESFTILNKLYFTENEICVQYNEATWVLFFNKELITQHTLETPYDLVRENKWTMDKMHEYMQTVSRDANGDGTLSAPDDYFGFSTHTGSFMGMLGGAGETLTVPDGQGGYVSNLASERMADIAMKIGSIINDTQATVLPDRFPGASTSDNEWARNTFYNGHSLFYGEVVGSFARLRDMEHDFGLIPFPKYEESQQNYTCTILNSAQGYCIPVSCPDVKMAADVTEALAIESLLKVRPAYLDVTVTGKSMRDEDSREMLDLIMSTRIYDICWMFGWGNAAGTFESAINSGAESYMSTIARIDKIFSKSLQKTLDAYGED